LDLLKSNGIDDSEKEFIDNLIYIENGLIPEEIRNIYWTNEEIVGLQRDLVDSVLENGKVDLIENEAMRYLREFDWWKQKKDAIQAGIINETRLLEDSDGDSSDEMELNNISELRQGTDPLNETEKNPNKKSDVYVVSIAGSGANLPNVVDESSLVYATTEYHWLVKFGIPTENIFLLGYDEHLPSDHKIIMKNLRLYEKWNGKDALKDFGKVTFFKKGKISSYDVNEAFDHIRDETDENDILIVNISGHGGDYGKQDGGFVWAAGEPLISNYDINNLLKKVDYGRALIIVSSCGSEKIIDNLSQSDYNTTSPLNNCLGIASSYRDGLGSSGWSLWLWENLTQKYSIKQAGEELPFNLPFVTRYYSLDMDHERECPWIDSYNPLNSLSSK
jgi:hypothetical protein